MNLQASLRSSGRLSGLITQKAPVPTFAGTGVKYLLRCHPAWRLSRPLSTYHHTLTLITKHHPPAHLQSPFPYLHTLQSHRLQLSVLFLNKVLPLFHRLGIVIPHFFFGVNGISPYFLRFYRYTLPLVNPLPRTSPTCPITIKASGSISFTFSLTLNTSRLDTTVTTCMVSWRR